MNKKFLRFLGLGTILALVLVLGIFIGRSNVSLPDKNFYQAAVQKETAVSFKQTADISRNFDNLNVQDAERRGLDAERRGSEEVNENNQNNVSFQRAEAIRVLDGDTIEIKSGEKVRYLGINAPESGQPFSTEATRENARLVAGRFVELEFDVQSQDRYNRLLAYVWSDSILVNKEIVKNGYAVSETIQPNVKYQDLILKAQEEARTACRGLWAGFCSQSSKSSCIKIANINADAPGNDNLNKNGEWIEIKNICSENIDMSNWLLKDSSASNKYKFKNSIISSLKNIIIYSGCGINTSTEFYWQCPEGKYAIWNNTGDHAFLYDAGGNLISDYQY